MSLKISRRKMLLGMAGGGLTLATVAIPGGRYLRSSTEQSIQLFDEPSEVLGPPIPDTVKHLVIRTGPIGIPEELDQLLQDHLVYGLKPTTLDALIEDLHGGEKLPENTFSLAVWGTGSGDFNRSLRVLDRYGIQASYFVDPFLVGTNDENMLNAEQLREFVQRGHNVGMLLNSASGVHPQELAFRLAADRETLEKLIPEHHIKYGATAELPSTFFPELDKKLYGSFEGILVQEAGTVHQRGDTRRIFTKYTQITPEAPPVQYHLEIPILMYHRVTSGYTSENIWVSQSQLRDHFSYLRNNGFESVTMDQVLDFMTEGRPLVPEKSFVAVFDDNWHSHFDFAIPIAEQYGFQITQGLITDSYKNTSKLWKHAEAVQRGSLDVQSHSDTHPLSPPITSLGTDRMRYELEESKRIIEDGLQKPVRHFVAPGGSYSQEIMSIAQSIGYRSYMTAWGDQGVKHGDSPWPAPRVQMLAGNSLGIFIGRMNTSTNGY